MRLPTQTWRDGCANAPDREVLPASPPVDIRVDVHHGLPRPLVRVSGELDIASVPLLVAMLDHARGESSPGDGRPGRTDSTHVPVDVDLSRVTFADSHGLAPVLEGSTTVVQASAVVQRVLVLLRDAEALRPAGRLSSPGRRRQRGTGIDRRPAWARQPA